MYIYCICSEYTWFIYSILCAYSTPDGWCWEGGQGPIPPAPPTITSKSPGQVITFILLEQGMKYHTGNIPGIYQVYSRYIPNAGPWTSCWIRLQGWPRGYLYNCLIAGSLPHIYLHLSHFFQGCICYNIFNPLNLLNLHWISWICDVSSMAKGKQACATVLSKKDSQTGVFSDVM